MISLVYKNHEQELDALIMCNDSKVVDLIKQLDGVKDYRIIPFTWMDNPTRKIVSELNLKVDNFRGLCKKPEFNSKLSDEDKMTIQELLNVLDDVQNKIL